MPTIEEFIKSELGKPNKSPKHLILEAYALGVSHGQGEDAELVPEDEPVGHFERPAPMR